MAELDREEFLKMQREAEQRMQGMRRNISGNMQGNMPPAPGFVRVNGAHGGVETPPEKPHESQPQEPPHKPQGGGGFDLLRMFNFKNLTMDSDRTVILGVLLLLCGESQDELLMLALVYIML